MGVSGSKSTPIVFKPQQIYVHKIMIMLLTRTKAGRTIRIQQQQTTTKKGNKMMISTAAKQRADKLEKLARAAITQYNKDMAAGSEPLFPDWALDLIGLITDYDRMLVTLAQQRLTMVNVVDFNNGKCSASVVRQVAS